MKARNSERSKKNRALRTGRLGEKAKGLSHASGGFNPWAWTNGEYASLSFDDSAECWRDEGRRGWGVEGLTWQVWLVAGAAACAALTIGWVGWVIWLVVGKG